MYNAKNYRKVEKVPAGEIIDGVIVNIAQGTARQFLSEGALQKYKSPDEPHIQVTIEGKYRDDIVRVEQLFSYTSTNGVTTFTDGSNLGKYFKYYKKLPEVTDHVKMSSNADGYFKIIF